MTLIHRHDYQQALTELPRVAGGTRSVAAVRIQLDAVLAPTGRIFDGTITGLDLAQRLLVTEARPEELAELARRRGLAVFSRVVLVEAGETILAELGVLVRVTAQIAAATAVGSC